MKGGVGGAGVGGTVQAGRRLEAEEGWRRRLAAEQGEGAGARARASGIVGRGMGGGAGGAGARGRGVVLQGAGSV